MKARLATIRGYAILRVLIDSDNEPTFREWCFYDDARVWLTEHTRAVYDSHIDTVVSQELKEHIKSLVASDNKAVVNYSGD